MKYILENCIEIVKDKKIKRIGENLAAQHHKLIQKKISAVDLFKPIDKILYINLEKRNDRRQEMQAQFSRLGIPAEKIERIDAVYNEFGALGCTRSHIKCLEEQLQMAGKTSLF